MSYNSLCKTAEYFEDRARRARHPDNHERLAAVAKKYRKPANSTGRADGRLRAPPQTKAPPWGERGSSAKACLRGGWGHDGRPPPERRAAELVAQIAAPGAYPPGDPHMGAPIFLYADLIGLGCLLQCR